MTAPAEAVRTIRLRTPAAWVDLDLDQATTSESIAAVVQERATGDRERLRAMLEAAAGDAVRQGAVFGSLFFDTVGGRAVSASLVVSVVDADPDGASVADPAEREEVRLAIARGLAADFSDGAAGVSEVRSLEAGPAARVRSRQTVEGSGPATTVDLLQYFVPFPDGDRLAVLTFSTPNLGLADPFAEVFDAIASTLQWPS